MPHIEYLREAGSRGDRAGHVADHARRAGRQRRASSTASTTCRPATPRSATSCCAHRETDMSMKIALAGAGAFGEKHLDGLKLIDGVEVVSLVGRRLEPTQAIAAKYGIGHACTDLAEALRAGRRCGDPVHADPDARRAGDPVHGRRQARPGRDPARRQPGRCRGGARQAAGDRPDLHGRPHPPLQSEPPVSPRQVRRAASAASSRWTCRPISSAART